MWKVASKKALKALVRIRTKMSWIRNTAFLVSILPILSQYFLKICIRFVIGVRTVGKYQDIVTSLLGCLTVWS